MATATPSDPLERLQQRLMHRFAQPALLQLALTHRSFSAEHNERLEFLGDSVLNLAVATLLYRQLSDLPEGDLSRVRANLVKQETLFRIACEMGLSELVRLGEGELRSGGQKRPSILADALEGVIGAVYLDAGYTAAFELVQRLFDSVEITPTMPAAAKDPKTELQEWLQGRRHKLPAYRIEATVGAAHKQTFEVVCEVAELGLSAHGIGASRRAAEQAAAASMLINLKARP